MTLHFVLTQVFTNLVLTRKYVSGDNPWSLGGSFMVQKMAITSPIPVF